MTKVRTTFTPDVVYDVGPEELLDLQRQGLLHSMEHGNTPLPEGLEPWHDGAPVEVESGQLSAPEAPLATEPGDDKSKKKGA